MPPTRPRLRPGDLTAADGSVTLTAPDELVLPRLDVEAAGHHLTASTVLRVGVTAEHVDTADLALLRSATALTRRTLTGDVDALPPALREELGPWSGWQLDAPGDGAGTTTRRVPDDTPHDGSHATASAGPATAPSEVTRWLLATVRGRDLITALRTRAEVSVHLLSDTDSRSQDHGDSDQPTADDAPTTPTAVVQVVERTITSTVPGRDVTTTTRELRVAPVAPVAGTTPLRRRDAAALVTAVVAALVDAGATPLAAADVAARGSRATAVLRRALDAADPGSAPTPPTPTRPLTMTSPAPDVARAAAATGLTTLVAADRTWRDLTARQHTPREQTAALTALADAARRAHAALTLGDAAGLRATGAPTADALLWVTGLLDDAQRARGTETLLVDLLRASPVDTVRGRARENLLAALTQRVDAASTLVSDALTSQRYLDLLGALDDAATPTDDDPPPAATPPRGQGARSTLLRLAAATDRRLVDDVEHVDVALDQDSHDALLNRVRHAALSAAALAGVLADTAGADSRAYSDDVSSAAHHLARHADTVGARDLLEAQALAADAAGLSSFTHGRLHGQVSAAGEVDDAAYEQAWASASRARRRRWMG